MKMKILIRGAGDLATGIASRLYHAGYEIVMTEIQVPLTVRRSVAFSRAVYEGAAEVEDMRGVLVSSMEEAVRVLDGGDIPVLVDPKAEIREQYQPDVVIDAILAKKNLGTRINDAPLVIGVGPGFTAGEDCHCVIETKRGHTLGRVIWDGSAIPNTGIPGNVGGYTTERLIRAAAEGIMEPRASIGDVVRKDQIVAVTGNEPVYAQMNGIVRGMLQPGVQVAAGMKIGDIDARCEPSHCETVSDKALSIGGGALEAVGAFERIRGKYAVAVLAAGASVRFGGNKLLADVKGKKMYLHMLEKLEAFSGLDRVIVTGTEEIIKEAGSRGICPIENHFPEQGISRSLKLAAGALLERNPDLQGILFTVCDQPGLKRSTILKIFLEGSRHRREIICAGHDGKRGNPVLWSREYFSRLLETKGDVGGRQILKASEEHIRIVEAEEYELKDIDRREEIIYADSSCKREGS